MKLRAKLISSYFGVAVLILVIGIVGIFSSRQILDGFNAVVNSTSPALNALGQVGTHAGEARESAFNYALDASLKGNGRSQQDFVDAINLMEASLSKYRTSVEESNYYVAMVSSANRMILASADLIQLAELGNDRAAILAQIDTLNAAEENFTETLNTTIDFENTEFQREIGTAQNSAQSAEIVYIVSIVLVIGWAFVLSLLMSGNILRPILQLQTATNRMMQGDYTQRTVVKTRDEIGELAGAFNTMADTVQKRDADLININQTLEKRIDERTKELRVATREAQEASRLKDEFLSIMSHELRTPLTAIIGFQGIMLMAGQIDDRGRHMLQRAQANSNRLLTLINDILDISRIESGRLQLVKTDLSPVTLVDRLRSQMGVLADEKKLDFVVEIDPSVPPMINTDEDAVTKIITNLLGNAFKFTDTGSVELDLKQTDNNLIIQVADTGIGIPLHMHQVIFERFRQVDGSSKRAHGGSGLGLAIVQKLCAALGGTIQVESVVGKGSTFTVTLPVENVLEKVAS